MNERLDDIFFFLCIVTCPAQHIIKEEIVS